jgi:pseudouridine-5'-phosphate glycosidase
MPPPVALESTVIAHGLPAPANLETARRLESIVRDEGATPRTVGIVDGAETVGLNDAQLRRLATADDVRKVSLRDLPVVTAGSEDGATTVAATMHLAHRAGIAVLATGGIGGVHRGADGAPTADVSADLEALRRLPMIVVCSGPKIVLALDATRERLETDGVTVVGYRTDTMPAFYSRSSGRPVDVRCDTPDAVATVAAARDRLDLPSAVLVTVPPPEDVALPRSELAPILEQALAEAARKGLRSDAVTPFLLRRLRAEGGDRVVTANRALLRRNARVAARIAAAAH